MFVIRADGNAKIGAGHLMRCLTIAEAVRKLPKGPEILVLCADEESAKLASDRGFQTGVFHTDYQRMEEELPFWKQWITDDKNTILVDSYYVMDEYLAGLHEYGRVCLMDDMQNHAYPVDVVVNYNVFADGAVYQALYGQGGQGYLTDLGSSQLNECKKGKQDFEAVNFYLGGTYAPLREQFQNVDYCVKERVEQVLITTGAGDADNIAGDILNRVYRENLTYHVLVGRFSPHLAGWQKRATECPNIQVHFDVQDMAGLMKNCDLAITAGGSTVYELSAVGVPFIGFAYAVNQELLVNYLGAKDVAGCSGNWHVDRNGCIECLSNLFERFCSDYEIRAYYGKKAHAMVDGLGAERLAKALCVKE